MNEETEPESHMEAEADTAGGTEATVANRSRDSDGDGPRSPA